MSHVCELGTYTYQGYASSCSLILSILIFFPRVCHGSVQLSRIHGAYVQMSDVYLYIPGIDPELLGYGISFFFVRHELDGPICTSQNYGTYK